MYVTSDKTEQIYSLVYVCQLEDRNLAAVMGPVFPQNDVAQ